MMSDKHYREDDPGMSAIFLPQNHDEKIMEYIDGTLT